MRRSLNTLLSLRHIKAEAAQGRYAAASAVTRSREEALSGHVAQLAASDLSGPVNWQVAVARRDLLGTAVTRSRAELGTARSAQEQARQAWTVERRAERVVEKLVERAQAERRAARAREEQRDLDEIAVAAHARTPAPRTRVQGPRVEGDPR